ncbi:MAG: glycosyltransferase family A protein, partial [Candidatus Brocadiaceae bacterium]|nr:glycosyltransferase family A protein [Candidatus Brocadiaceae bacterium]
MTNLRRDGYDYASDVVSVAGKQRIKLASDAPKLVIGIPIRGEIDEPTLQGPLITTGRTIAPEFMVSMLQCLPPINTSTRFRLVKGKLGGPARDDIINDAIAWNAKYIIFLDDDVLFPDYTFSRLVKNMELYPDIGWLTGVYCTNKIGYSEPLIYQHYGDGAFWSFE